MKRLSRDGHVLQIPRPKDQCYLYMPNPAMIHTQSAKIRHFLAIADFYIQIGKPDIYEVEPHIDDEYKPDAYTRLEEPIVIEVQRTHTSHRKMQQKVEGFIKSYKKGKHDAKTLYIVANENYRVSCPSDFKIEKIELKEGVL